jgi:hypothetical protein
MIDRLLAARAAVFHNAEGRIGPAAAELADMLDYDDDLRRLAAVTLLALLFEPGFSQHCDTFAQDTGGPLGEFVAKHLRKM